MATALRVLHLSAVRAVGGAEESLLGLLARMDRDGVRPVLACPMPAEDAAEASTDAAADLADRARALGVEVEELPLVRPARTWSPARLWDLQRDLAAARASVAACAARRGIDLIHANGPAAALQSEGAPVVAHMRDLRLPRAACRMLRRRVRLWIAPSRCVAAFLRRRIALAVRHVPNGVDTDLFHPAADEGGTADAPPLLLMAAHWVPWKRHEWFLEILAEVRAREPRVRGAVAGGDPFGNGRKHADFLRRRAEELGLQYAFAWDGILPPGQLAKRMAGAAALIHPTPDEPFGRVVIEAMACGTPVVACARNGPGEILADGGGVACPPGDLNAMVRAALDYVRHREKARAAGARGRELALERYSFDRHARAMERMFREAGNLPAG